MLDCILYCIVFALICGIAFFFLYPHYQEYEYKKDCLQNGDKLTANSFVEWFLANKALNAFTDTLNASIGYANNWDDFATNLAVNGFTNSIGLGIGLTPIGRGLGATGKKIIKQGFNFLTDKAKNMLYDNEDD